MNKVTHKYIDTHFQSDDIKEAMDQLTDIQESQESKAKQKYVRQGLLSNWHLLSIMLMGSWASAIGAIYYFAPPLLNLNSVLISLAPFVLISLFFYPRERI